MKIYSFILLFLAVFAGGARAADPLLAIKLNNSDAVQYCKTPVLVAESLTIEGNFTITGMKISISEGYVAGEDELVYPGSGSIGNIVGTWAVAQGYLLLKGDANTTVDNFRDAIKSVTYRNNKAVPTLGNRKISITLDDADYLDETKHFYQFIKKPNITWTVARDEASNTLYHGVLKGYLATITSKNESDFINLKTEGLGWIGASDADVEVEWRWVTGPEGLEDNGKGRLFWKGTGGQAKADPVNYGQVNGAYQNWNRWETTNPANDNLHYEPNDYNHINIDHEEDYAHITFNPTNASESKRWNDYPNNGGSAGYLIEFGGFAGEPVLELSATLDLQVNTMLFKTGAIEPICEGTTVSLNQPDANPVPSTYIWTHPESLTFPSGSANPVASPISSTLYQVTGTRGACTDVSQFLVTVNPKPVSQLRAEENICTGQSVTLDPGVHSAYSWSSGATSPNITVSVAGDYSVKLTSDKNCTSSSSTKVIVHEYPTIDLSNLQTLICGEPKSITVKITTTGSDFTLTSTDGAATVTGGLNVSVPRDGIYPMAYKASFYPTCPVVKNFELAFYRIPAVSFSIDSTECYRYNLDATYIGDADLGIAKFTWVFGGDTIFNGLGGIKQKIPLGVNQSKRDLSLKVEQNGCSDQHVLNDIRVIPTLSLFVKDSIRCLPDAFEFTAANTETGVTYDWNFGDGTTGSGVTASHQYTNSGKYDIQLTVTTNKNCSNTVSMKELVFAASIPDVAFSLSPGLCLTPGTNKIAYTGAIGNDRDKYYWNLSHFAPSEIIVNPLETKGPFEFDLKTQPSAMIGLKVISEFGCESKPDSILVKRKPVFSIAALPNAGCTPFEPLLKGTVADAVDRVSYSWDFGDGTTGTGDQVKHEYPEPDHKYDIILTALSSTTGCSDTLMRKSFVWAYPKPKAAFSMDHTIVYNDAPTVNFSNMSTGDKEYSWDFGDGATSEQKDPSHIYKLTGYRTVLLEVFNEYLCSDTVSHRLLVAFDRIFPPNGFSPNAPNEVDREFKLGSDGITAEGYHLTILSRWNDIVFETRNEIKGWDGHAANGSMAPAGVYLWVLNFTDFLGRRHRQNGTVTLVY